MKKRVISWRRIGIPVSLASLAGACDRQGPRSPAPPPSAAASRPVSADTKAADKPPAPTTKTPEVSAKFSVPWVEAVGVVDEVRGRLRVAYDAAKAGPNDASKISELGMFYQGVAAPLAAAACFGRAAELEPSSARWWYLLALAHEAGYERSAGLEAIKRAAALKKDYSPIFVKLGQLSLDVDTPAAKTAFQRAVDLCPDDGRGPYGLGQCEERANHREQAIEQYRRAVKLTPEYGDAHRALAGLLTGSTEQKEAKEHEAAAQQGGVPISLDDPYQYEMLCKAGEGQSLVLLAKRLMNAGRRDHAEFVLKKVIDRGLALAEAHNTLGMVYYLQKRLEPSAEEFRLAVAENPTDVSYKSNLAQMQVELGRYQEGEQALRKALYSAPGDLITLGRYGRLLLALGRPEDAAGVFDEQLKLAPNDPEYHFYKIAATVYMHNPDDAAEIYKRLRSRLPAGQKGDELLKAELTRCLEAQRKAMPATTRPAEGSRLTDKDLTAFAEALEDKGLTAEANVIRSLALEESSAASSKPSM